VNSLEPLRKFLMKNEARFVWWDVIDALAVHFAGAAVLNSKGSEDAVRVLDEQWLPCGNIWIQRMCVLHQNLFKGDDADEGRLFACIDFMLSPERQRSTWTEVEVFFVDKAIGWALRQHAKRGLSEVSAVKAYLKRNAKRFSALSVREASKAWK